MRSFALRRASPRLQPRSIVPKARRAEGAARQTRADKSRAYAIALCECCEACAAVEIAGALGACSAADVQAVVALGTRTKGILSRLVRP
jgi:four helix bundle protein